MPKQPNAASPTGAAKSNERGAPRRAEALVTIEPDALLIPDACKWLGVGRTKLYRLARDGRVELIEIGGRTHATMKSLRALVNEAPKPNAARGEAAAIAARAVWARKRARAEAAALADEENTPPEAA